MSSTSSHFEGLFDRLPVRPDRRAHPRGYAHRLAYVQLGDENGGIALNISEGGLAITTAETLTSDYFPRITFQLPRSDVWMEARGEVAWISHSKKEAGIRFVELADSDREKIRKWIANNDSAQSRMRETGERPREGDVECVGIRGASTQSVKDRKLEVLSEADEAKFAGMFPSEKSLTNAREREVVAQDAVPRITERSPRNVLQFSEPILKRVEHADSLKGVERVVEKPAQAGMAPSLTNDSQSIEEETPRSSEIPQENSLLVSRVDTSTKGEHPRMGEIELAQPLSAKAEPEHNNSAENESLQHAAFPKIEPLVAKEADESSKGGERDASGKEQEAPAFVLTREVDLIQQLELHRRNREANRLLGRDSAIPVERRSGWLLAALILLIGMMCFALGIGVGNGFFDKLLGRDREIEERSDATANLPASTAGENDFAGGSAVAGSAQKSAEASPVTSAVAPPNNTTEGAAINSPTDSEGNAPVQAAPTGAVNTKSGDSGNLAAKDQQRSAGSVPPTDLSRNSVADVRHDGSGNSAGNSLSSDAPANDATDELRATPGTTAASPAEAETARPFSEIQAPILVTAPDERSGPFRLALTEQAVSASRTLAISAQRFVWVPAQPGPASSHRPERLQAGVLIFHVDPLVPTAGNQRELSGTVKVRTTVGKSGDVVDVQPISGPALLIPAVVRAVREWRYTVTLLDGQPIGAEEDVVVEFRPRN